MLSPGRTRLAVWGDPIAHSRSPLLHEAAYAVLGVDWSYGRRQVDEPAFADELRSLDGRWRGLSLTMPLKSVAFQVALAHDRRAELTRAVNTLMLTDDGPRGYNTDVGGIVETLKEAGVDRVQRGRIVGAGATATSALVALAELGAREVTVVARRPEAAEGLGPLAAALGVRAETASFASASFTAADVTIATLPGEVTISDATTDALATDGGVLLDVVYGHWPTDLARGWERARRPALSGLGMLLHQAVLQIRIFTSGDPEVPLRDEAAVLAAMRRSVMGD